MCDHRALFVDRERTGFESVKCVRHRTPAYLPVEFTRYLIEYLKTWCFTEELKTSNAFNEIAAPPAGLEAVQPEPEVNVGQVVPGQAESEIRERSD